MHSLSQSLAFGSRVESTSATELALLCFALFSGAKLLASPDDGVELVDSLEADGELARHLTGGPISHPTPSLLRRTLSPTGRSTSGAEASGSMVLSPRAAALTSPRTSSLSAPSPGPLASSQHAPQAQQHAPQQSRTIEIVLSAVGVGLQFVHLDAAAAPRPGSSSRSSSRPGSASGSRHSSSVDLLGAASPAGVGPAGAAGAAAAPAPARSAQMLAASLDLDLAYKIQARTRVLGWLLWQCSEHRSGGWL